MKIKFLGILALILVCSCSSDESAETVISANEKSEESLDTLSEVVFEEIQINDHLQAILDKSTAKYALPIVIDTNFIKAIDFESKDAQNVLNFENVRYLTSSLIENEPTEYAGYSLNSFFKIDSLKAEGEYEDYVNGLDIGMMQEADAYGEGLINLENNQHMLLWSLNYSTYEACPYGYGSIVFGTLLNNYEVMNTLVLAEVSGGSDPPAWGDTNISSELTPTLIKTNKIDRSSGYDEEAEEEITAETKSDYEVTITAENLKVLGN